MKCDEGKTAAGYNNDTIGDAKNTRDGFQRNRGVNAANRTQNNQMNQVNISLKTVLGIALPAETTRTCDQPACKIGGTTNTGVRTEISQAEIRHGGKNGREGNSAPSNNNNAMEGAGYLKKQSERVVNAANRTQNNQMNQVNISLKTALGIALPAETTRTSDQPARKVGGTTNTGVRTEISQAEIRHGGKNGREGNSAPSNKNNAMEGAGHQNKHKGEGYRGEIYNRYPTYKCNSSHTNTSHQRNSSHTNTSHQRFIPYQMQQGDCDELARFCTKLRTYVNSSGTGKSLPVNLSNSEECSRWIQVWSLRNNQNNGLEYLLPIVMLELPDSQYLMPAIEEVVHVLCITVSGLKEDRNMRPEDALRRLEAVVDVIKCRLAGQAKNIMDPESVLTSLGKLNRDFSETALKYFRTHRERVLTLIKREEEIRNYAAGLEAYLKSSDAQIIAVNKPACILSAQGWSAPTVAWLLSDEWHNVRPLKTQYENSDEYARTLEEVWTLLTFYWGAAAMRPKCQHVQKGGGDEDKCCSEPLLQMARGGCCSNKRSGIQCSRPAVWQCHRVGHNGICAGCLAQKREQLIGPPGQYASTDIYDAVVERETTRREGSVYLLTALRSRKPPTIDPNWSTTYRLQPAALVAVVRLGAANQRLAQNSPLQWAEVVCLDTKIEWQTRQEGRISLRLLTKGDCPTLSSDSEMPLEPGTRIALIDLRVFVPEVISVLATLARSNFVNHFDQIPFKDRILGIPGPHSGHIHDPRQDIVENIISAINHSEIEFVHRLDETCRHALATKISDLPPVKSLYGTQLEAFTGALASAAHLSQGPPGTGKSYIGVCLVLALDVIRSSAMARGISVGPILVLSYKNHALDEFLIDVIKLSKVSNLRIEDRGNLIRAGKPERLEELQKYSEMKTALETKAQHELEFRISVQRNSRRVSSDWHRCASMVRGFSSLSPADLKRNGFHAAPNINELFVFVRMASEMLRLVGGWDNIQINETQPLINVPAMGDAFEVIRRFAPKNKGERTVETDKSIIIPLLECLPRIMLESEHMTDKNPSERLEVWLKGEIPPHRCIATDGVPLTRCLKHVEDEGGLCLVRHRCLSQYNGGCLSPRVQDSPYCELHKCNSTSEKGVVGPCNDERLTQGKFCMKHSCPSCINDNRLILSGSIGGKYPHACEKHQCWGYFKEKGGILSTCSYPVLSPHPFCMRHCCVTCGESGTVLHTVQAFGSLHCLHHKCLFDDCKHPKVGPFKYCTDHICKLCIADNEADPNPIDSKVPWSGLCSLHRCSRKECTNPKLLSPTAQLSASTTSMSHCLQHACRVGLMPGACCNLPIEDEYPRNVCSEHPLCTFISVKGNQCAYLAIPPFMNKCETHEKMIEVVKTNFIHGDGICCGMTKVKKRCKAKGTNPTGGQYWCHAHKNQTTLSAPDGVDEVDVDGYANYDEYAIEFASWQRQTPLADISRPFIDSRLQLWSTQCCSSKQSGSYERCDAYEWLPRHTQGPWNCIMHRSESSIEELTTSPVISLPIVPMKEGHLSIGDPSMTIPSTDDAIQSSITTTLGEFLDGVRGSGLDGVRASSEILPIRTQRSQEVPDLETAESTPDVAAVIAEDEPVDYREDQNFAVDPDEMECSEDEGEEHDGEVEPEGYEEMKRLREINANDTDSDNESEQSMEEFFVPTAEQAFRENFQSPHTWSWAMPGSERLRRAAEFLHLMSDALVVLRQATDEYVVQARMKRSDAGCEAFKRARVVAATVVGASRRLEAIRAAEPFAVVVEEACEVMEPTLISVLAVKSLRKLELIGDHRQLPAFIQNCWYNLQTTLPSIKTSLFERLIQDGPSNNDDREASHAVPHTVLDEQRRMTSAIADITRHHYEDVVKIIDHPLTAEQAVGDAVTNDKEKAALRLHRAMWSASPSSIPGVRPTVYFWDLPNNKTSRAVAGLSACNEMEANAVTSLAKWLILCGTPPSSISIITPYKGQKSLLIKKLRLAKIIPGFSNPNPNPAPLPGSTLTVSTVDRYQGDENDIIIYSNVRTQAGNKFVTLKNRFIVTTSRARLGFYLVGSVSALIDSSGRTSNTSHWSTFIKSLKVIQTLKDSSDQDSSRISSQKSLSDNESDTELHRGEIEEEEEGDVEVNTWRSTAVLPSKETASNGVYQGPRVGSTMPICCPRHRSNVTHVTSDSFPTSDGWSKFCSLPCSNKLQLCGHHCPLLCHSPVTSPHVTQDKCIVPLVRACMKHIQIPLLCKEIRLRKQESLRSAIARADCLIVEDFVRKECNHVVQIPCHVIGKVVQGATVLPNCVIIVGDFIQPACGHKITAPTCFDCRKYEERPPPCMTEVRHIRPCGCKISMRCHESLSERKTPTLCTSYVLMKRPRCAHEMTLRCHVGSKVQKDWDNQDGEGVNKDGLVTFKTPYGPSEKSLNGSSEPPIFACEVRTSYRASCGHIFGDIACDTAFEMAAGRAMEQKCESMVTLASPICGHEIEVPCWVQKAIEKWSPWGERNSKPHTFEENDLLASKATELPAVVKQILKKSCQQSVKILRSCKRGHELTVKCADLYFYLILKSPIPRCLEPVQRLLACSHHATIKCCEQNNPPPACNVAVKEVFEYPCGEHEIDQLTCNRLSTLKKMDMPQCPSRVKCTRFQCGHEAIALCHLRNSIEEYLPGAFLNSVDVGEAVVIAGAPYCSSASTILPCREAVTYRPVCGHDRQGVPCSDAFAWADGSIRHPRCEAMVTRASPVCGHLIEELPCWSNDLLKDWQPWHVEEGLVGIADVRAGVLPDFEILSHCDQYGQTVEVISVAHDSRVPAKAPIPHEMLICNGSAMLLRVCGHSESLPCVQALYKIAGPCEVSYAQICDRGYCGAEQNYKCSGLSPAKSINVNRCVKLVSRYCTICKINKKNVKCSEEVVQCRKPVIADLKCHHETSWVCGKDKDPRLDPPDALNCFQCVVPLWRSAITAEAPEDFTIMELTGRKKAMDTLLPLLSVTEVLEKRDFPLQEGFFQRHLLTRKRILNVYARNIERGVSGIVFPPPAPGSITDIENYDVVFQSIPSNDFKGYKKFDTKYGLGYRLLPLTVENLRRERPGEDGLLRICVGLAYKHKCLEGTFQFRKGDGQLDKKNANKQSIMRMSCGYDCVDVHLPDKTEQRNAELEEKAANTPAARVYWYDDIAMPLCIISLKLHIQCILCFDSFSAGEGMCCSKGHLVCWESCFKGYIDSCGTADAPGSSVDTLGNVKCPHPKCKDIYTAQLMIDNKADAEATEALEKLRMMAYGLKEAAAAKAQILEEIRLEEERIQNIKDGDEREAHILKKRIVDDILSLRCPKCRSVFLDFSGCFALTCHKDCRAGFCGWCLKHFGNDAHAHVPQCREGKGMHAPFATFEEHHRLRKEKAIQELVNDLHIPRVRQFLVKILQKELNDLRITIRDH